MKYLLDTNTCIRYLTGRSMAVFRRLEGLPESDICTCSVVQYELRYGALRTRNVLATLAEQDRFLGRFVSLPFDGQAQVHAADIRAHLARLGTPIGPYDLLIAGIARASDLVLVTHNTREFARVPDLALEDWETDGASSNGPQ